MKATRIPRRILVSIIGIAAIPAFVAMPFNIAFAQDSTFLACGQYSDRGQRIACLEDALEAATATRNAMPAPTVPPATPSPGVVVAEPPDPAPAQTPATAEEPAPLATAPTPENDPSLLERLRNFGKRETVDANAGPQDGANISTGQNGQEQLQDTIAKLEKRNNLWIVTLSSGQVWMQQIPRRLNLREGDEISIYQAGIGNGYRLASRRLSGFIRVERMR